MGGRRNLGQSRGKETRGGAELGGVVEVQKFDKCNYNYNYNYSYKSVEDCFVWELEEMTVTLFVNPWIFLPFDRLKSRFSRKAKRRGEDWN